MALGGLLISLILPAYWRAMASGRQATCLVNIRQVGSSLIAYAADNNGYTVLPFDADANLNWCGIVTKWDNTRKQLVNATSRRELGIWLCPENKLQIAGRTSSVGEQAGSFTINGWLEGDNRYAGNRTASFVSPSKLYMVGEGISSAIDLGSFNGGNQVPANTYPGKGANNARYPHGKGMHMCFADGHVELLRGPLEGRGTYQGGENNKATSYSGGTNWHAN